MVKPYHSNDKNWEQGELPMPCLGGKAMPLLEPRSVIAKSHRLSVAKLRNFSASLWMATRQSPLQNLHCLKKVMGSDGMMRLLDPIR
jgi:hypothetical protein